MMKPNFRGPVLDELLDYRQYRIAFMSQLDYALQHCNVQLEPESIRWSQKPPLKIVVFPRSVNFATFQRSFFDEGES